MAQKGFGKPGYCKICAHPMAHKFIQGAREGGKSGKGWNAAEAQEAGKVYGLSFNRQTWYAHLEHARTAEARVIQAAEMVRKEGALTLRDIERHNNTDVLEAIRDLGMKKALDDPEQVTLDHALKSIQILEQRKDKGGDALNVLVQFVVGQPPAVVIEGQAREVPADEQEF